MLKLAHFYHLPQLDPLFEQLVADGTGLTIVAGLDPRTAGIDAGRGAALPSSRSAIFRILVREILLASPWVRAVVVTQDDTIVRIPRELRRRVNLSLVVPPEKDYAHQIADALRVRPGLLVVDHLDKQTAPLALDAAKGGTRVLSQLDTVFRGGDVARHLLDLGVTQEQVRGLRWVVAVERLPMLCPTCKERLPSDAAQVRQLGQRHHDLFESNDSDRAPVFYRSTGCAQCRYSGRRGDVAVFDVFCADPDGPALPAQASLLSLEEYAFRLACQGSLSPEDVARLDANLLHRTYSMLTASEGTLAEANAALQRRLLQLEAANRVLQQRTEALISLQDVGQALIMSTGLDDLAARICRHACDMCGAERAILYVVRGEDQAEVLAVRGWDRGSIHRKLGAAQVFSAEEQTEPAPFAHLPPGVSPRSTEASAASRVGLRVPLLAQGQQVGLMIVHTSQKPMFLPGEVALFRTFANQAAVAIQRAGLIEELRAKIAQLEAAQVELVQKERLERELELARQVQQSVLPRVFPQVPGYTFSARNEPARQVGGDFYDVIRLPDDRFGLVIADVSDKGMPAALYMALTRSLLLAESRRDPSPCAVLANVNRLLLELGEPNMFVTVFYGIVQRADRQMIYARAGHDFPLLLRQGTARPLRGEGACLGILSPPEFRLGEEQLSLASGDRLVLYTDGLKDVMSPDGHLSDRARLESLLQANAGLEPGELCAAVFDALSAYQGGAEQYDDMTLLVVGVE